MTLLNIITWTPSPGLIEFCKMIAGLAGLVWVVVIVFGFLMPSGRGGSPMRKYGAGKMIGALIAILIMADITLLPKIVNTVYQWVADLNPLQFVGIG